MPPRLSSERFKSRAVHHNRKNKNIIIQLSLDILWSKFLHPICLSSLQELWC